MRMDCDSCGRPTVEKNLTMIMLDETCLRLCMDCLRRARHDRAENEMAGMSYEARRELARASNDE